jgi:hypothetical protein
LVITLEGGLREAAPGASIRSFIAQAKLARLSCPPNAARRVRSANTPQEREALLAEISDQIEGAG